MQQYFWLPLCIPTASSPTHQLPPLPLIAAFPNFSICYHFYTTWKLNNKRIFEFSRFFKKFPEFSKVLKIFFKKNPVRFWQLLKLVNILNMSHIFSRIDILRRISIFRQSTFRQFIFFGEALL